MNDLVPIGPFQDNHAGLFCVANVHGGLGLPRVVDQKRAVTSASRLACSAMFVAGFSLLAIVLSPVAGRWHRAWLIRQLAARVSQTADAQVEVPIRQLARLGLPAIDPLVATAASERAAQAYAAHEVVSDLLTTWEIEADTAAATNDFGIRLGTLARALARVVDRLSPTGKHWAEGLALRILLHAEHVAPNRSAEVLADCQSILASVPPRGPRLRNLPRAAQPAGLAESPPPLTKPQTDLRQFAATGELAERLLIAKPLPRLAELPAATDASQTRSPLPTGTPSHAQPNRSDWSPEWGFGQRFNPSETISQPIESLTNRATTPRLLDVPTPDEMQRHRQQLRPLPLRKLIAMLGTAHDFEAAMVFAVIEERGLSKAEVALATLLVSSEPSRRLQLLEELTQLPAASARRWLRWLLDDTEGEVRLRALTMMATTGDPRLFDLARQRAVEDADPRVVKLAAKIMQSQK